MPDLNEELERLRVPHPIPRQHAARALAELGDPRAVEPLCACLADESEWVRLAAAEALGKLADARAVEPLVQQIADPQEEVRAAVHRALARFGPAAVSPLAELLSTGDKATRTAAAVVLGELADRQAVAPLCTALRGHDWEVRAAAATALGRLGDVRAVTALQARFQDWRPEVRRAALDALIQIGPGPVEAWYVGGRHHDPRMRELVVTTLADRRDPAFLELLIESLMDQDVGVRRAAIRALERLGSRSALPALQARLPFWGGGEREESLRRELRRAIQTLDEATAHARAVPIP
ncbi:MAG: HEAT repeat domain-containing protein, partial [Armatimonadetes bacterium]|nr:HEAT repeat domain-containing protein [Armatimonadota bacterium]